MLLRERTDLIVVHVTATPPHLDIGAAEIAAMHKALGWSEIGYHYVIRRSGRVEPGRHQDAIGAHVTGYNSISLGVALVGGVDTEGRPDNNATPAQMQTLEVLLRELVTGQYRGALICGHRDLSPDRNGNGVIEPGEWLKACPCFDVIPWARSVGLPAAEITGAWDPAGRVPRPRVEARNSYLQRLLARAGYQFGPVDGVIGARTVVAIRAFQAWAGVSISGVFDAPTVARLRALFEPAAAIALAAASDDPLGR